MNGLGESCPFKVVLSGGGGFFLGGAFGLFTGAVCSTFFLTHFSYGQDTNHT